MKKQLEQFEYISETSIKILVNDFYRRIRSDEQLGPIFEHAITDWDPHLATMVRFWSSVMMTSGQYKGNPVAAHSKLQGLEPQLFERWLKLFGETCGELFNEPLADAFRLKAARIAESLKLALFYRPDRPWPMAIQ